LKLIKNEKYFKPTREELASQNLPTATHFGGHGTEKSPFGLFLKSNWASSALNLWNAIEEKIDGVRAAMWANSDNFFDN
jgi:hypothetical protein